MKLDRSLPILERGRRSPIIGLMVLCTFALVGLAVWLGKTRYPRFGRALDVGADVSIWALIALLAAGLIGGILKNRKPLPYIPPLGRRHTNLERALNPILVEIARDHMKQVEAGRIARDISSRLSLQIAEARELFFTIVGENPRSVAVFNAEVVRILCGGDAAALGKAPQP